MRPMCTYQKVLFTVLKTSNPHTKTRHVHAHQVQCPRRHQVRAVAGMHQSLSHRQLVVSNHPRVLLCAGSAVSLMSSIPMMSCACTVRSASASPRRSSTRPRSRTNLGTSLTACKNVIKPFHALANATDVRLKRVVHSVRPSMETPRQLLMTS